MIDWLTHIIGDRRFGYAFMGIFGMLFIHTTELHVLSLGFWAATIPMALFTILTNNDNLDLWSE